MSTLSKKVEVLVVGAGPTGLLTALELARAGIEVEIIDLAWRTAAQSYACGLHPATIELLTHLGLGGTLTQEGLRADSVAFYEGCERKAEVDLRRLNSPFPYLLVLPQFQLEELLEDELRSRGVTVRWGHRLDRMAEDANGVTAAVEQLVLTSVGYPFARSEEVVERTVEIRAQYVVGADGCHSHVRQILQIPVARSGAPTVFEVFEYEPSAAVVPEVRIAMGAGTADAFWPQPGCMSRWSLETPQPAADFPYKDRQAFVVHGTQEAEEARKDLECRLSKRAPWYDVGVREVSWTTRVAFSRMVVGEFGRGRCWLTGDAGHQTGPVGMQSMNVGIREAADLAGRLKRLLRESAPSTVLSEYDDARRSEWRFLLGTNGAVRANTSAGSWVRASRQRLVGCLPGSGSELREMAGQLGLEWA